MRGMARGKTATTGTTAGAGATTAAAAASAAATTPALVVGGLEQHEQARARIVRLLRLGCGLKANVVELHRSIGPRVDADWMVELPLAWCTGPGEWVAEA